ncbi:hypothetical protein K474DRAFT_1674314 [Panus rudis PR-1116 ss-1]|nr:hypothetical protein K474DRAFT_1674314 [Panus rudis PR-1116 ss-1]
MPQPGPNGIIVEGNVAEPSDHEGNDPEVPANDGGLCLNLASGSCKGRKVKTNGKQPRDIKCTFGLCKACCLHLSISAYEEAAALNSDVPCEPRRCKVGPHNYDPRRSGRGRAGGGGSRGGRSGARGGQGGRGRGGTVVHTQPPSQVTHDEYDHSEVLPEGHSSTLSQQETGGPSLATAPSPSSSQSPTPPVAPLVPTARNGRPYAAPVDNLWQSPPPGIFATQLLRDQLADAAMERKLKTQTSRCTPDRKLDVLIWMKELADPEAATFYPDRYPEIVLSEHPIVAALLNSVTDPAPAVSLSSCPVAVHMYDVGRLRWTTIAFDQKFALMPNQHDLLLRKFNPQAPLTDDVCKGFGTQLYKLFNIRRGQDGSYYTSGTKRSICSTPCTSYPPPKQPCHRSVSTPLPPFTPRKVRSRHSRPLQSDGDDVFLRTDTRVIVQCPRPDDFTSSPEPDLISTASGSESHVEAEEPDQPDLDDVDVQVSSSAVDTSMGNTGTVVDIDLIGFKVPCTMLEGSTSMRRRFPSQYFFCDIYHGVQAVEQMCSGKAVTRAHAVPTVFIGIAYAESTWTKIQRTMRKASDVICQDWIIKGRTPQAMYGLFQSLYKDGPELRTTLPYEGNTRNRRRRRLLVSLPSAIPLLGPGFSSHSDGVAVVQTQLEDAAPQAITPVAAPVIPARVEPSNLLHGGTDNSDCAAHIGVQNTSKSTDPVNAMDSGPIADNDHNPFLSSHDPAVSWFGQLLNSGQFIDPRQLQLHFDDANACIADSATSNVSTGIHEWPVHVTEALQLKAVVAASSNIATPEARAGWGDGSSGKLGSHELYGGERSGGSGDLEGTTANPLAGRQTARWNRERRASRGLRRRRRRGCIKHGERNILKCSGETRSVAVGRTTCAFDGIVGVGHQGSVRAQLGESEQVRSLAAAYAVSRLTLGHNSVTLKHDYTMVRAPRERHTRSKEKQEEQHKEFVKRTLRKRLDAWAKNTVNVYPPAFKNEFATGQTKSKRVRGKYAVHPSKLGADSTRSRLRVHNTSYTKDGKRMGPRVVFVRYPKLVAPSRVRYMSQLLERYRRLRPKVMGAVDRFLKYTRRHVLDPLGRVIEMEHPEIVETMTKVRCYLLSHEHIRKAMRKRPALNFGRLFTTMALSEGGSQRNHVDWLDDPNLLAWVIPLGNFGQSYTCFPQLGKKYALRAGDACGMASRHLSHCAELLGVGQRDVITMFTHRSLVKAAEDWWDSRSEVQRALAVELMVKFD